MQQLSFLPGEMTPGERSLIQRALKTLDRHLHEPGVAFTSTRAAREWLILNMAGLEREEFRVLYLNNQNQLIAGEKMCIRDRFKRGDDRRRRCTAECHQCFACTGR